MISGRWINANCLPGILSNLVTVSIGVKMIMEHLTKHTKRNNRCREMSIFVILQENLCDDNH